MYVTLETFEVTAREFLRSAPARSFQPSAVNFLPGPVTVRREVRRAFEQAPESHRADCFKADFKATREERYLEAVGFSVSGACTAANRPTNCGVADIDVTSEHIANGVMDKGTFDDVDLRVENRFDRLDTKFKQITLDISQRSRGIRVRITTTRSRTRSPSISIMSTATAMITPRAALRSSTSALRS